MLSSLFCIQAHAQLDAAVLAGHVLTSSGIGIPGAHLTLIDVEKNTRIKTTTNDTGLYIFPELDPGHYRVEVAASGFRGVRLANLYISTADAIQQNFWLAVGYGLEPAVEEAKPTPLDMSAGVKTIVDPKLARELPLNGRSFQTLFQLAPGIVITRTDFSTPGQFSVNGQRTNANYVTVDGVSANVGISAGTAPGQTFGGALPALSVIGSTNSLVAIGDVREFVIQTSSYGAEFGRMPGAHIGIVTRSGTNDFHGELFEYFRNDVLDANDWFANHNRLPRAALRQNDFGGVLGGPFIQDSTFFFASYEALRLRQPTMGESDVPTIDARRSASAAMQAFLNAYPLPTRPDEGNGLAPANYAFSNPSDLDAISVRVDHYFSPSISVFARSTHSPSDVNARANGESTLNTVTRTDVSLDSFTVGLKQLVNQHLNNDLRFNWTSSSAASGFRLDSFGGATPLDTQKIFPAPYREGDSVLAIDFPLIASNSALELGRNAANRQHQINVVENLSWNSGKHVLNCGFDFRYLTPQFSPSAYSQVTAFNDVQSAAAGKAFISIISAKIQTEAVYSNYSLYTQGTWRRWTRAVFSYGLRWEFDPAPSGGGGGLSPFAVTGLSDLSTLALAPSGTKLYRAPGELTPRLGFAYQLRGSSSTESVLRAGAGIFYDLNSTATGDAFTNFPFAATKILSGQVSFPLTATDAAPPPITPHAPYSRIIAFPHALKEPYSYEWNVGLEQAIGRSQALTVSYLGSVGRGLIRTDEYIGGDGLPPAFTAVGYVNNSGYANYNGLQTQFRRRANKGLDIIASYTFAHSLDNVSSDAMLTIPAHFLNPATDYGSSDFDVRHSGAFAIDYDLPGTAKPRFARAFIKGWSLDSILIIRSSPTVNVVVNRDIGYGRYDFRPDVIPGAPIYFADPAAPGGLRINSNAFSVPLAPRQGNLGRNALRGLPLIQGDLAVRRVFRLRDKLDFQARIEAFNVLNHPNFSPEEGQLGMLDMNGVLIPQNGFGVSHAMLSHGLQESSFGTGLSPLYQIGSSRSLQLSVRFEF